MIRVGVGLMSMVCGGWGFVRVGIETGVGKGKERTPSQKYFQETLHFPDNIFRKLQIIVIVEAVCTLFDILLVFLPCPLLLVQNLYLLPY